MDEDSKVTPMRPLREVLAEFEEFIESERANESTDEVCEKCNNTGTEVLRNDSGVIISAKPCKH